MNTNRLGVLAGVILMSVASAATGDTRWAESFDDIAAWRELASDGVGLKAASVPGIKGSALRIDYDFARGSGYGIVRHEFSPPLEMPENYRFRFQIRGEGPRNTLEFKLVEKTTGADGAVGESVWWINQPNYQFPVEWRSVSMPKRKFGFAWGPSGGTPMRRIDALEIVVTSFSGGRGSVFVDELALEALPAVKPYTGQARVDVSSRSDGGDGPLAINAEGFIGWRSAAGDQSPTATIDFGEPREFGGMALEWEEAAGAADYRVEAQQDGGWSTLASVQGGNGGRDYLVMTDAVAQRVRIISEAPGVVALKGLRVLPSEFGDSPNELFKTVAADAPRGWYPRYWSGEGVYWNVVGTDRDAREALIGEDGAIELDKQGPSIEPFIESNARLLTWNESTATQSLEDGYLPIPRVIREVSGADGDVGLKLEVVCVADDAPPLTRGRGVLWMRYTLTNTGLTRHAGTLYLAARPMQVNPTYQFLNTVGGVSRIQRVKAGPAGLTLDGRLLASLTPPAAAGAAAFEQGEIVEHIAASRLPTRAEVDDPAGLASGAMAYAFDLEAGGSMNVHLAWAINPEEKIDLATALGAPIAGAAAAVFEQRFAAVKTEWKDTLNRVEVRLPGEAQRWWNSARSNVAYVLINRDGPGIQPGSRSYERTWIRDGSLTSSALLALGHDQEVREFLDWFAPYQYDNGKVPCCVDRRGPDPVPEHDSHGQYIYSVMNLWRYTGDTPLLRRHWDRVLKAVEYIEFLRAQRMTDEFRTGPDDKRVLYGLMPESISHEGYSAKPMHSYWDDFWTLKGLEDAAAMAAVLGEEAQVSRLADLRDSFRTTLYESIRLAMRIKNIDYIPGCAELGDFDATSTTIGVWPCDELGNIPEPGLTRTFERYWRYCVDRRDATGEAEKWVNYTPYEWRTIGTMIRLGWRDRAHELSDFFFADSRPAGWNHWAEVVWRDHRHAGFIGDMPHTWVGSDFINAFRSMIAYENDREQAMVLGAGIPLSWLLSDEGVSVKNLKTHFGALSLTTRREGDTVMIEVGGGLRMPEGGLTLSLPNPELIKGVRVEGSASEHKAGAVKLERVPASVEVEYGRGR